MNPKSLVESCMYVLSLNHRSINMTILPHELADKLHNYIVCNFGVDKPCKRCKYVVTTYLYLHSTCLLFTPYNNIMRNFNNILSDQSIDELSSLFEMYSTDDMMSDIMCSRPTYKIIKKYVKTNNKRSVTHSVTHSDTRSVTHSDTRTSNDNSNYIFVNITSMSTELLNYMLKHNTCSYIVELPDSYFF